MFERRKFDFCIADEAPKITLTSLPCCFYSEAIDIVVVNLDPGNRNFFR